MSGISSLKELERKAFRTTFQDGLWDIYLGMLLFLIGGGAGLAKITSLDVVSINLVLVLVAGTVVVGFFLLIRFLRDYPLQANEAGEPV